MASATTAKKISPSGTKRKADSKEGHVKGAKKSKVDGAAKPEKKSSKTEEKPEKKAKKPKKVESNDDDSDDMDVDGGVPLKETEDTPMEDAQDGIHPDRRQFAAGQGPNGMQKCNPTATSFLTIYRSFVKRGTRKTKTNNR